MPITRPDFAELDALFAAQQRAFRDRLQQIHARAQAKKATIRRARHQAIVDYDLDQSPAWFDSHMGPRARTLSQIDGDE